ncbi:efflux RND transporter periplasmic adaptor subunit [Paenibacillus ginsengarvi]|uniref:Efflux transporter periplasmic adaptor subunit n=1 Tax=Paenibacillus ginsengarvi TaxID=400777 RepID=A0A3B0AYN7_9BACL|nr:efflux transporter periplasmic adaptor subunit [Paenibacillus ginsengarvi]RKN65448.1 efflux transporter periplasmic adaptor subunit [Paenibacillus ginsengarvi]
MFHVAKGRWVVLLLLGALAAVQAGCSYVSSGAEAKPELLKPVKKKEELYEVKSGSLVKQIRGVGVFIPSSPKYYQYTIGGKLGVIRAQPGDTVNKGDVLLELDPGDMPLKIAQQKLVVAKAEDSLETAKGDDDKEKLRLAGLNREVEQARLEGLEQNLAKTKLLAERAGKVVFLDFMKPGDTITSYKDVIALADPQQMLFQYSSTIGADLSAIEKDMTAEITFNGKVYTGKVVQTPRTAPTATSQQMSDRNARTVLIEMDGIPPGAQFGSQGDVTIVTDKKENVLTIPRVGLRSYQGRNFVHVKDGDSRKEIDVEKGLETATEVEIRRGLKAGQQVILNN